MNVTLPNGKVIQGVPEGTPKNVIMQKAISSGLALESDFNVTPQEPALPSNEKSITDKVIGGIASAADTGLETLGSAVAGATALVDTVNPFTDNDPKQLIENVKDKFKFDFISEKGEAGKAELADKLQVIEPAMKALQDFSDEAGQQGLDVSGSPAFATFVNMIPDILMSTSGVKIGRGAAKDRLSSPEVEQAKKTAVADINAEEGVTGIKKMTSDVFPPETRLGKLFQTQGELVAGFQRKGQQEQRIKAVEKLANNYDIVDGAGFDKKIVDGLKSSVEKSKAAIAEMYDQSSKKLDELGGVPLSKTKKMAQSVIERESAKGSLSNKSVIEDMQSLIEAPDDLSFEMVKEIRSGVGSNIEKIKRSAPVQGSGDLGLLKRTYAQMTTDMTDFADNAAPDLADNWKKSNKAMSEFATGANKQGAKAIIRNGDTTPEVVDTLLFSKKPSDLDFLTKNLDQPGKKAAQQRVIERVLDKSSIDGEDINPNKFLSQMNKNKLQINKMFDGDELKALTILRDDLIKTRRAQDAKVTAPTSQQTVLAASILAPLALIPGVVQGVIETPTIRNLIIKRSAKKSAKERSAIDSEIRELIDKSGLTGGLVGAEVATQETQNQNKR